MTKRSEFDVVIVGGGPAGLALGIGLARRNMQALILEKKQWPIDKACGEGVMPAGVRELEALGALPLINEESALPFSGLELISARGRSARIDFQGRPALGIRRTALSSALFELAQRERNLVLLPQTSAVHVGKIPLPPFSKGDKVQKRFTQTSGETFTSRFVVGADGLHSSLRSLINAKAAPTKRRRYGANVHFEIEPWNNHVEVHMTNGVEAYVTPCGRREVGVAFLWDYSRYAPSQKAKLLDECLERFPLLRKRLQGRPMIEPLQSAGPMHQIANRVAKDGIVLIGDAAGYGDAITGEGVTLGLIEARLLADTLSGGRSLAEFTKAQALLKRKVNRLSKLALTVARYPTLQNPAFALLQQCPWLLRRLMTFAMS